VVVVDTNIVSEMVRDDPNSKVLAWTDMVGRLYTIAVTLGEIDYGIARLLAGRFKDRLTATAIRAFADFDDVILPSTLVRPVGTRDRCLP
jgi:predicted nucleic acid-binding protein